MVRHLEGRAPQLTIRASINNSSIYNKQYHLGKAEGVLLIVAYRKDHFIISFFFLLKSI